MNIDDPIFTELALKAIAGKANETEKATLKELLKAPEMAAEFKQLQADVGFAREILPLMGEEPATTPPLSDFEHSQLERLVKERADKNRPKESKSLWSWKWVLGLAGATAVIVIALNWPATSSRTVQFAMIDSMGSMRGTNNINLNLVSALQENFGQTNFTTFSGSAQINDWLNQQPSIGETAKVVYDRDSGEIRIIHRNKGNQLVTNTVPVIKEENLPAALKQAHEILNAN
jgi:hypothetical protein